MTHPNENIAAVVEDAQGTMKIQTRPIPTPGPKEVLVRNFAIAANPIDWMIQAFNILVTDRPIVLGSDVCGEVIAVGDQVTRVKKGDRVTGFAGVCYNHKIDHGAWQNYTLLQELATTKIPKDMSYPAGATFPLAIAAACMGLFFNLDLPRTQNSEPTKNNILLVWGASSSVGAATVQVAKYFGFTVFGAASPNNFTWLKALGIDELFDRNDKDVVNQIVSAAQKTGKVIGYAYDSAAKGDTFDLITEIVQKSAGKGKIVTVLDRPAEKPLPEGIESSMVLAERHGHDQTELGAWIFNEFLEKRLADGTVVVAPPAKHIMGGIEKTPEVLAELKGGVSGSKLVLQLP